MPKQGLPVGLVLLAACTSMQRVEPGRFIPAHNPSVISVWTKPNNLTIVSYPQVVGDTLSGVVFEEPWAVPLEDVVRVEAKASDRTRTLLFVAGAAASSLGLILMGNGKGAGAVPCPPDLTPSQKSQQCGIVN